MRDRSILIALVFLQSLILVQCYNVSYDHRAIIINGERQFLISGSVHYPRSTPSMWDPIFKRSKEAGLNTVEIYVFWNYHEPVKGQYNFTGNADIVRFIKAAEANGLWVVLRLGPYVCAEWNYGGFPVWLRDIPDMKFRTYNQPFMDEMATFTKVVVDLLSTNKLFAPQGGPIILAQIENEYGWVEHAYGANGTKYVQWAIEFAIGLDIGVPWVMCAQDDVPQAINTCNGFYCDGWIEGHFKQFPNQPAMWTENWPGWFQHWGEPRPIRPAQDVAFAYARWVARGGTHQNYYMWHGGTTFGRWTGGPNIITSYDYDVALDEWGYPQEPKFSHSARLHAIFIKFAQTLLKNDIPKPIAFGGTAEVHVYGTGATALTFMSNWDHVDLNITYEGKKYTLPAWSVLIYNNGALLFNTQSLLMEATLKQWGSDEVQVNAFVYLQDEVGAVSGTSVTSPPEQISFTKDTTDYLWYSRSVAFNGSENLVFSEISDYFGVWVDNTYISSQWGGANVSVKLPSLQGTHTINILSATIGLINYGLYLETAKDGIRGQVMFGKQNITSNWKVKTGLKLENMKIYDPAVAANTLWSTGTSNVKGKPLIWYYTQFSIPQSNLTANNGEVYAIDMTGMGKGQIWVNGNHLGRYWMVKGYGSCKCDLTGASGPLCSVGCDDYSQQYYHLPADWLIPSKNVLVIQEELGGDPDQISIVQRTGTRVCGSGVENYPSENTDAYVQCAAGTFISKVEFANYGTAPTGSCGSYKPGSCARSATDAVTKLCAGHSYCSVPISPALVGDPCPGTTKFLVIQVICA